MKVFKIDLNNIIKVNLFGREKLIPPRVHITRYTSEYIFYAIIDGYLKLKVNDEVVELFPGEVYIFDKGVYQAPLECSACEYYYVHFEAENIEKLSLTEAEYKKIYNKKISDRLKNDIHSTDCYRYMNVHLFQKYSFSEKSEFEYILSILKRNSLSRNIEKRFVVSYEFAMVLFKLENSSEEKSSKDYYIVKKIVSYLEKNFNKSITGHDIENVFFISFDYANRLFKKVMDCSIIKYRNVIRINNAKTKMCTTDMQIQEIALEVGFENIQYFSRFFKKCEGVSPKTYREKNLYNTGV